MSQSLPIPPPGFEELSIEEQINYIEALLDSVGSRPDHVKIPKWHWEILTERIESFRAEVEEGMTWEEFQKELENDLMQR